VLSNYERGRQDPSLSSLWKILDALGASLTDLEDVMGERDRAAVRPLAPRRLKLRPDVRVRES